MAKRKPTPPDPLVPEVPAPAGKPQIELRMRGDADDVKRQMGVAVEPGPVPEKQEGAEQNEEKEKFIVAIRNPRYVVKVKRRTPREFAGHCWDTECPVTYAEIQEETKNHDGGGSYRVSVVDPESNRTVAGDTFDVPGDPILPQTEIALEEQNRLLMRGAPKDAAQLTVEGLSRRAEVTAKMLEVEALEQQLKEQRDRRKGDDQVVRPDTRIDDLERRLMEAKHQAELEARDRKHAEEMRELKALIAQNAAPAKPQNDMMTVMLEQMREDRKASQAQFTALLTQIKDDKLTAVLEEVKAIKNKPNQQSSSLLDQAEAILKLKKVFGWGGDDDDDDDDDAVDPDDKRPWWERALDKLGGKWGDKLIEKLAGMEEKGEVVDREKFMREMSQYADEIAAEAASRQQRQLPNPTKPPALPAPPPAVPAAPAQVQQLPPPPPAGGAPAVQLPPPPPAAPVQQLPQTLTIEQEITVRVGTVLDMLDREATFRANEYHWNYEGCWMTLPDDLLEKVCAAADGAGVVDALTTPLLAAEKIAELKTKLSSNPKTAAWFMVGLNELKEWYAEKQKDPMFDPFADDEEEGAAE